MKASQNARILAHLRIAPITALQALKYIGCPRPLRHRIESQVVEVENERRERKRVAKYWLLKEAK